MSIAFWSLAFVILCQIIAFSFWLGRLTQRVSNLQKSYDDSEITTSDYRKDEKNQTAANLKDVRDQTAINFKNERDILTKQSHLILPECQIYFTNLSSGLSKLEGKVDMLIMMIGKKNG